MRDTEAAKIAEALGHLPVEVVANARGDRFAFVCSCGYRSTGRTRVALAIEAGVHHMRKVAENAAKNGADIPTKALRVG
jgi:hypothetical protein